jgi:diguanylate cyclase (GGDEF)-like protein
MNIATLQLTQNRNTVMQTRTSTVEMIKDLKEVKGIFQTCDQADTDNVFKAETQQQIMLDLSMRLQMSLEVDWVINQFMEHVHSYLLFDGYSFGLEDSSIEMNVGRQQGHSFTYDLTVQDMSLGKLVGYRGRRFSESELVLIENLLVSLLYPLRNALNFRKATLAAHRDSLTGVNNRSTFDASLEREICLSQRQGSDCSLLFIDIDFFKKVNDTYGHSAGDEVLKKVAETIKENTRNTDLLFRYGGEEFVAILNNSDCEAAYVIADRILESVREATVRYQNQDLSVSVSIGLACLSDADSAHSLLDRADSALYEAKDEGRDQIVVSQV